MNIRPVKSGDFERYVGHALPPNWSTGDLFGYVAEHDMQIMGIGIITRDVRGRLWAWEHNYIALSAVVLHRTAKRLLAEVKRRGDHEVYAFCHEQLPTAARWMQRLGFEPDEMMWHPLDGYKRAWKWRAR